MKTNLVTVSILGLFIGSALAGPDVIIKQRAKELSNQNNVRQGVTPPGQPAPQTKPATTQPGTMPLTPLQASLARLRGDLISIHTNAPVTSDIKQRLSRDFQAIAQTGKPTQSSTDKLAGEVASAFAEKALSPTDRERFITNINAALNPANMQPSQLTAVIGDVQAIFQVNGLTRAKAAEIGDSLKAVSAETQKTAAK